MKKLTEFSVRYPVTILMFVLAVLLLGYISFRKLGIDLFPDLNNPRIFVELTAGEKSPEEIEQQLVDRIESLTYGQKKVVEVSSISRVGGAQVTVEYSWDANMDEAFLELQKTLASFGQGGDIDELTITQHDPNAEPVMLVALSNPQIDDMNELRKVGENYIRNELIRLEGIADVKLSGQEEREVVIETDSYRLEAHGLTTDDVAGQIQNFNRNVSGGSIVEMGIQYVVKGVGVFQTLKDIENLIVAYDDTEETAPGSAMTTAVRVPIFLKDVADVTFRNREPDSIVRTNRNRCIGLSIYKETRYNTVKAVRELEKAFGNMKDALPGFEFTTIQNQGNFINASINEVKQTALIGIILAVIILYVFLRRIGATAIISVAIPISVVATFNLMYFNGLTLNIMTLGGLALGAGMLVDNAIVVMENIFRHLEQGKSIKDAAIQGTAQVAGAITAATLTTIVVFLPIVYLHGASGELFKDQAWTVAFSLLSSLVVAILVIPMLSTKLLKKTEKKRKESIRFDWYPDFLSRVLDRRWWVILGAAGLVVISLLLIPLVGSEFIPRVDATEFTIELKLPEGTELERTSSTVESIENMVYELLGENLATLYAQVGETSDITGSEGSVLEGENAAVLKVLLNKNKKFSLNQIIASLNAMLQNIPDLDVQFMQDQTALQATLGTDVAPIILEFSGEELEHLESLTRQAKDKMQGIDDLFNIETNFEEGAPEIEIVIDRYKAGLYNVSVTNIGSQITDQLLGNDIAQWEYEGDLNTIRLRMPDVGLNELEAITVRSGSQTFRLDELATFRIARAPREIYRRNQTRIGRVTADLKKNRPFSAVVGSIETELEDLVMPADYRMEITGEEQKRQESFRNLSLALLLSVVLVYMVLASQFESLIHPFTIMLTVPLAGVGAILAFFIVGKTLNIMAYIGIIMLIGIAVNDSIILVDAINQLKLKGKTLRQALLEAGQRRIRPIIMTSITTILALLPLTFGFGEGAALRSPMALAVIGGLITSTLLTLIVIPCVYYVFDQATQKLSQWKPRKAYVKRQN